MQWLLCIPALALLAVFWAGQGHTQSDEVLWDRCGKLHRQHSDDLAISACSKLIQSGRLIDRNLAVAFNNRGLAYYRKGDHDRAIANLDRHIALQKTDIEKAEAAGVVGWTLATSKRRDAPLALRYARQAVRLAPSNDITQGALAAALTVDRQVAAALAAHEKVMRIQPDYVFFYQKLLKKHGLYAGRVDGQYGPATRAALRARIATGCFMIDEQCP